MSNTLIKWSVRLLPLVYAVLIWIQSSEFDPETAPGLGGVLEAGHLILFGILYIFLWLAFRTFGRMTRGKESLIFLIVLLCAFIDEIHQSFVPFRSFSYTDLVKDFIGIAMAWLIMRAIFKHSPAEK